MKQWARAARTRNSGKGKKKMVVATTGPAGVLYKKWTAKDAANFDGTNDTIAEYVGFMLGAVASKAVRTLSRPMNTSGEKPGKKYRLVAQPLVEWGGS